MKIKLTGTKSIHTDIKLPASKSISNRALILKALSNSPFPIHNLSDCDDTRVMIDAFDTDSHYFDVGAAGTSMRFLTAFLSRQPGEWEITGTERMQQRPINVLVEALNSLGARIEYLKNPGYPPLKIKGSVLNGGEIYLSGGISSQFISAILMIAPLMEKGLTINLEGDVISIPYIKMTLRLMEEFSVKCDWVGNIIKIFPNIYLPREYTVESDWSAASYWYEIVSLCDSATVELKGLFKDSVQGDSKVAGLFVDLGVDTKFTDDGVILTKTDRVAKKMFHNFINEPDLAQTFVVTCCLKGIPFLFTGLQSLKIKETDRIEALKAEMKKLGYVITDSENSILEWNGERCELTDDLSISTYEDHRMAMAFAPASLKVDGLIINEPKVVTKSYPYYWDDLAKAGFSILDI